LTNIVTLQPQCNAHLLLGTKTNDLPLPCCLMVASFLACLAGLAA